MQTEKWTSLSPDFFARDPREVARDLLGKVLCHKVGSLWLSAQIIETEAYLLEDKASHASLGFTEKRKALFMPPGTIYMYYARGGDSLNFSCLGPGNAVLIKAGIAFGQDSQALALMHQLNPCNGRKRSDERLCSGQTLLCRALGLKVPEWDQKQLDPERFVLKAPPYKPLHVTQTTRLGIPKGRDEHLPYRYVDTKYGRFATKVVPTGL